MPDEVVVDTGPLIALALLGYLGVLRTLYGRVLVPEAVWREVHVSGGVRPGAAEIASASWIEVVHVPVLEPLLRAELGAGEAEVIALAATSGGTVLIDERRGRRIAETVYGLAVRGTLGTLIAARRRRLVPQLRPALEALQRSGYHLAPNLIEKACRIVGE